MTDLWQLPRALEVGPQLCPIYPDFRDVLGVIAALENPDHTPETRLYVALSLFYRDFAALPRQLHPQAVQAMLDFLAGGRPDQGPPGPKLFDWQQDADLIVSDVNRVAGREVRSLPFVHWWTFLGWFFAIGEGRLSTVLALRQKLKTGKKLEPWERDFYVQNKARIVLKTAPDAQAQAEKQRLEALLSGKKEE